MAAEGRDVRAEIRAAYDEFNAALSRGDVPALLDMYTDDAQVMMPGADVAKGRQPLRAMLQGGVDSRPGGLRIETTQVEALGDTAIELGTATLLDSKGAEASRIRYIVIWKRVGGKWKIHIDFGN